MPASTSSKTSVSGASVSTSRRASIVRANSPPLATRDSGSSGKPGVGGDQERHVVAGRLVADGDLHLGVRHRQRAHDLADGGGQLRRARSTAAATACARVALDGHRS